MSKLLHGNCLNLMQNIPDKSVDMILADLPYGKTNAKWDSVIPLKPLWKEYKRIIKDHGCIALFGSNPFTANLIMSNPKMYRYDWVWYKTSPTMFLQCHHRPLQTYENISIFYKHLPIYHPQMRYSSKFKRHRRNRMSKKSSGAFYSKNLHLSHNGNKQGVRYPINIVRFSNSSFGKKDEGNKSKHYRRLHPTQKPTDLLRYLIKTYTNKNDLVLDNVMGSGSTGVAAKQLSRRFIGIELNDHYFKVAEDRINRVENKQLVTE